MIHALLVHRNSQGEKRFEKRISLLSLPATYSDSKIFHLTTRPGIINRNKSSGNVWVEHKDFSVTYIHVLH